MELQKNDYSSVLTEVKGEEYDGGALPALERVKNHRMWERAGECHLTSPGSFPSESVFFYFVDSS